MKEWKWLLFNWPLLFLSVWGWTLWPVFQETPYTQNCWDQKRTIPLSLDLPAQQPTSSFSAPFRTVFFFPFLFSSRVRSYSRFQSFHFIWVEIFRSCSWSIYERIRDSILTNNFMLEEYLYRLHSPEETDQMPSSVTLSMMHAMPWKWGGTQQG